MGDYIDREATIGYIEKKKRELGITNCNACNFKDILRAQPAADVRPVVRGRWIEKPYLLGTTNVCSVCGENYGMPHGKYNFCPNCGADMRGGDEL